MTFKILFLIKTNRIARNGETPIQLRVTVNGERTEITTDLKVKAKLWHPTLGKSLGTDSLSEEINNNLDIIRVNIMKIKREMELDGEEITSRKIIDKYQGKDKKTKVMLLEAFKEHNEQRKKLIGKGLAAATVERYEITFRHTREFIRTTLNKEDIPMEQVDHNFINAFEFFLKTECNCCHNTTTKYLKNFKKIILSGLANEWIKKNPFINIKFHLEEVDPTFLEEHELRTIMLKPLKIERLMVIRDTFIFCCFTGLAFSDVEGLKQEHLVEDNNKQLWIRKKRKKTNNMCNIPLLDIPSQILEKYKDHPLCIKKQTLLPVCSNQKMNAYLKEIADICGIKKELTTHTARHTYATSVCLAYGVTIENVAKMLGHTDTKMTRHYARILDKSIVRDMKGVNEIFKKCDMVGVNKMLVAI